MCVTRELCNLYKAEVKKKGGEYQTLKHVNVVFLRSISTCVHVNALCLNAAVCVLMCVRLHVCVY